MYNYEFEELSLLGYDVAPWCPACAQLKERFSSLAAAMAVYGGEVDPTIFHVKEGSVRRYVSVRKALEFHAYVSNTRWEEVEPLPSMSCMAGLFRLSLWIRWTHGYPRWDLGVLSWGSYLSFAMETLVTGLLMGLVLVLLADCLCPPNISRKRREQQHTQTKCVIHALQQWLRNLF
uniref:Thioredoxin domain-containing protein n=1 Tax=Salmo trutta TaxID=8032 RepID=A0A674D6C2_SALTR